jgi:hypothetical protein
LRIYDLGIGAALSAFSCFGTVNHIDGGQSERLPESGGQEETESACYETKERMDGIAANSV